MVVYAMFIFAFYTRVSKKFVVDVQWKEYKNAAHPTLLKLWDRFVYSLKYILLSPFLFFLWGAVITLLLLLFNGSKPVPVETTLLISMSLLATIRVTAYLKNELAGELAKTLPLAILAVFVLDMNSIDVSAFFGKVTGLQQHIALIAFYFAFTVALELLLRLYDGIANRE